MKCVIYGLLLLVRGRVSRNAHVDLEEDVSIQFSFRCESEFCAREGIKRDDADPDSCASLRRRRRPWLDTVEC
jgi:hypothetical protein